ncbi:MAG: Rrf2 family transcriptional regulator [Phycisphaeraceae bacterium]|nr:Rrf2 family transcriptional regulator [Phycisphaeraceae bacterium]
MLFSQTAEYALRAMVALAEFPDRPQTSQQIAQRTQIPASYLSKVLNTMVKAGLVDAQRGIGGGFKLLRQPAQLSVLDVINLVEPIERIHDCPLKISAHRGHLCPLHQTLDQTLATLQSALAKASISDLIHDDSSSTPAGLCKSEVRKVQPTIRRRS